MFTFKKRVKKTEDFTSGPLLAPYLRFGLALLVSNLAQSLYNTADRIIIGRFSGDPNALASMEATGTLSIMLINTIISLTVGATITLARAHGKKDNEEISGFLHTSLTFALVVGVIFGVIGQFVSMPLLRVLNTKPELIENAAAYIRIIFLGLPFAAFCSFADIALRNRGKGGISSTIIVTSGILNVLLNILFVSIFNMTVRGVALATIMSQAFSAISALIVLYRDEESIAFRFRKLHINPKRLGEIIKIGAPNSVQAIISTVARLVTVPTFNSLSLDIIRADAAANSAMAVFNQSMWSFTVSAVAVAVAQNYGARNYKRIRDTLIYASLSVIALAFIFVPFYLIFPKSIISLFADSSFESFEAIVSISVKLMMLFCFNLSIGAFSCIFTSSSRALGHPFTPLIISASTIGFGVAWCLFVFPHYGTPLAYYIHLPISALLGFTLHFITNAIYRAQVKKEFSKKEEPAPAA